MDKSKEPRICEILGVEVGEHFGIDGFGDNYFIDKDSDFRCGTARGCAWTLARIVNNPEWIIHRIQWTQEDIEDAKAVRKLFPTAISIHRSEANDTTKITYRHKGGDCPNPIWHSYVDGLVCPSLKPGEDAEIDEILEAEV